VRDNGHTSDPHALVRALIRHAVARGATLTRARVVGFEDNGAQVSAVVTDAGRVPASHVVLAAGAWSRPLAAQLGDRVPLDTERGYHVVVHDPEKRPRTPMMYVDGNFGAIPMDMGLRLVGTVELGGLEAAPDWNRAALLLKQGRALFPGLGACADGDARITRWMGFRPSLPDSLPVIGASSRFANAFHAFGHGHVGMCGGSTTGRVIADLVAGRSPSIPIEPFSPKRFS
jgi:D-amino-acid dehydrogenase